MTSTPSANTLIYGIKNCDTVKKARKWLISQQLEVPFIDIREQALDKKTLALWANKVGWETIFNKRSTTFRNLPENDKTELNELKAIELMHNHPTLIKRPILFNGENVKVGFKESDYKQWFKL